MAMTLLKTHSADSAITLGTSPLERDPSEICARKLLVWSRAMLTEALRASRARPSSTSVVSSLTRRDCSSSVIKHTGSEHRLLYGILGKSGRSILSL